MKRRVNTFHKEGLLHHVILNKNKKLKINFCLFILMSLVVLFLYARMIERYFKERKESIENHIENRINNQGSIITKVGKSDEYILFLLNTAEFWKNSGVYVHKGDKIEVTISGGFNSSINELVGKTESNRKLTYNWTNSVKGESSDTDIPSLVNLKKYRIDTTSYFGSLLMQIQPETKKPDSIPTDPGTNYYAIKETKKPITVKKNGYLYFTVNDICLTEDIICKMRSDTTLSAKMKTFINGEINNELRTLWFNDNIGSVLVNMKIERKGF